MNTTWSLAYGGGQKQNQWQQQITHQTLAILIAMWMRRYNAGRIARVAHIPGFTRSHWMLPSGECLFHIAPAAAMVKEFVETTQNTNKTQLLASNQGTFRALVVSENFIPQTKRTLYSGHRCNKLHLNVKWWERPKTAQRKSHLTTVAYCFWQGCCLSLVRSLKVVGEAPYVAPLQALVGAKRKAVLKQEQGGNDAQHVEMELS